jgi:hypothetical protein
MAMKGTITNEYLHVNEGRAAKVKNCNSEITRN